MSDCSSVSARSRLFRARPRRDPTAGTSFGSQAAEAAGRRFASPAVEISRRYERAAPPWWTLNQTAPRPLQAPPLVQIHERAVLIVAFRGTDCESGVVNRSAPRTSPESAGDTRWRRHRGICHLQMHRVSIYLGPMEPEPREFLPLPSAPFHILVALTAGEKHGYAVMNDVQTLSDGSVKMGPGTLYGTLKRLVEQGLVEESDHRPDPELDDERRRYYRLSPLGALVCAAEAERLASLARVARRNLRPGMAT